MSVSSPFLRVDEWLIKPGPDLSILVFREGKKFLEYYGHREGVRNKRVGSITHLECAPTREGRIRSFCSTGSAQEWSYRDGILACILVPSERSSEEKGIPSPFSGSS